jgi:predicted HicB family RNase H-like nuclease
MPQRKMRAPRGSTPSQFNIKWDAEMEAQVKRAASRTGLSASEWMRRAARSKLQAEARE